MEFVFNSSSEVPIPSIFPSFNTTIRSASSTEETLCAIIILVVFGISSRKAFRINASVLVSTALVESSRINIFGFFKIALAIQILCFCPPETLVPP